MPVHQALANTQAGGTPAELAELTASDLARWAKVIREAKIAAD